MKPANYRRVAAALIAIGLCLTFCGCAAFYRSLGMTEPQVAAQVQADKEAAAQAVSAGRELLWQVMTIIVGGVGTILTGLLARWLGAERTISKAMILGVEKATPEGVKDSIRQMALALGVQDKLDKRVQSLTA